MTYSEIRDSLKTGDLILVEGKGMISSLIRFGYRLFGDRPSDYSHIGMVVRDETLDMVYVWESTTLSKIPDAKSGVCESGVQIVEASSRVKSVQDSGGSVMIRKLNTPLNEYQMDKLSEVRKEFSGREYENDTLELFKAMYDWKLGKNIPDLSSLFCSEMVAAAFQRMELFDGDYIPANEFTPEDFVEGGLIDDLHPSLFGRGEILNRVGVVVQEVGAE
jgi:hypothetical protein